MSLETFIVPATADNERLDVFLASCLSGSTRSYIKKLIDQNLACVENQPEKGSYRLKSGQQVTLEMPEPVMLEAKAQEMALEIVYEDESLIIINKPKGLVVHPAPGNQEGTLVNALMYHCGDRLSDINGVVRPGIVHRIDKETSGLLAVAKTNEAHHQLSAQLKDHTMSRTYYAIVDGVVKTDSGSVESPIGRHPVDRKRMAVTLKNSKTAVTHYEVIQRFKGYTYMRFHLQTGRTHQIRVHMASLGHPVTGDPLYGKPCRLMKTEGQMLHAGELSFIHPTTGERVCYQATLPEEFSRLLEILNRSLT